MLTTRQIGIITFGISIFLAVLVISFFFSIRSLVGATLCPAEVDGAACPVHQTFESLFPIQVVLGIASAAVLAAIGLFLIIQESKFREREKVEKKKTEFEVMLGVLTTDERKVIGIIKEQPGIPQNTLCLKTDFSKAKLSMLLKDLEDRGLIKKEPEGKTYRVYLKK